MDDDENMCGEQTAEQPDPAALHGRVHTCTQDRHRATEAHRCWCGERWLLGARVELSEGERR